MSALIKQWQNNDKFYRQKPIVRAILWIAMSLILIGLMFQSVSTNQVASTQIDRELVFKVTISELAQKVGIHYDSGLNYQERLVRQNVGLIADIRWPRILIAGLVGAALGMAGAAIQGVFRNPLADPGLIGVSSGAALGAVSAILVGFDLSRILEQLPPFLIDFTNLSGLKLARTLAAFGIGLIITLIVYRLSRFGSRTDTVNLLLIGLALNSISGAYIGLATYIGGDRLATDIVFWSLGSVANMGWQDVYIVLIFVSIGAIGLPFFARDLNIMSLGEAEAQHLGVHTQFVRRSVIFLSALMVGVSVGFTGIIAFIGLVTPHIMRFIFGPDHRTILPSSAIGGAIFLVVADMLGRTLPNPATPNITVEVPVGILTAIVGGPFFLFLLLANQIRKTSSI